MDQEVVRRRNTVFSIIYRRVMSQYPQCIPRPLRWILEIAFLLMALLTLLLWSYVHFTYVVDPVDCLADIQERPFSNRVILQVEVYSNTTDLWTKAQSTLNEIYPTNSFSDEEPILLNKDAVDVEVGKNTKVSNKLLQLLHWMMPLNNNESEEDVSANEMTHNERQFEQKSLYELLDIYTLRLYSVDYTILEFSQEPGYLSLSQTTRTYLNISTKRIYIDPEKVRCFGGRFGRFITKYFLGYEMMIIASFKNLLPIEQGSGYVKNLLTGSHYYYRVQWMGKWRYVTGLLPTLFFTLVASILLRQIHYHGFKFLTHFHHLLNEGIPMPIHTGAQVPFLVITYATIGLVIVMSEALGDDSLFSLLMVATVWEADQFYAVFCRHKTSKIFFPLFFFLYHAIPYAYFVRFNGQFWFLPFVFHWFLLQNAILLFLHHFEVDQWQVIQHEPNHHQPFLEGDQQQQLALHHPHERERDIRRDNADDTPPNQGTQSQIPTRQQPATPVEESLAEERSAFFISTQGNISPMPRDGLVSAAQDIKNETISRLDNDGLRERRLLYLDSQSQDS